MSKIYSDGIATKNVTFRNETPTYNSHHLLPKELIRSSEENSSWTFYSSLFPENKASIHLHLKNGFRLIGMREKNAQQDGVWRDSVLYERRIENV